VSETSRRKGKQFVWKHQAGPREVQGVRDRVAASRARLCSHDDILSGVIERNRCPVCIAAMDMHSGSNGYNPLRCPRSAFPALHALHPVTDVRHRGRRRRYSPRLAPQLRKCQRRSAGDSALHPSPCKFLGQPACWSDLILFQIQRAAVREIQFFHATRGVCHARRVHHLKSLRGFVQRP